MGVLNKYRVAVIIQIIILLGLYRFFSHTEDTVEIAPEPRPATLVILSDYGYGSGLLAHKLNGCQQSCCWEMFNHYKPTDYSDFIDTIKGPLIYKIQMDRVLSNYNYVKRMIDTEDISYVILRRNPLDHLLSMKNKEIATGKYDDPNHQVPSGDKLEFKARIKLSELQEDSMRAETYFRAITEKLVSRGRNYLSLTFEEMLKANSIFGRDFNCKPTIQ